MENKRKVTGITKKMDSLHRLLIPKTFCDTLRWDSGTPLEISKVGNTLVVKDISKRCCLCGRKNRLLKMDQTFICRACAKQIGAIMQNSSTSEKAE